MIVFDTECYNKISSISTLVIAVATCIYTALTYKLFRKTNQTFINSNKLAEFQIYSEISKLLSSNESSRLLKIIDSNWFEIDIMGTKDINPSMKIVDSAELNRIILGPLEDLAKFHEDKLITIESINTGFGNTILKVWSNKIIRAYISKLRTEIYKNKELYSGIENLFNQVIKLCTEEEKLNISKYSN